MKTSAKEFHKYYFRWLDDCLEEFNERWGNTLFGYRKYWAEPSEEDDPDYEPWDLVEFDEDGTAWPHGIGGSTYIKNAVTKWKDSPHFVE